MQTNEMTEQLMTNKKCIKSVGFKRKTQYIDKLMGQIKKHRYIRTHYIEDKSCCLYKMHDYHINNMHTKKLHTTNMISQQVNIRTMDYKWVADDKKRYKYIRIMYRRFLINFPNKIQLQGLETFNFCVNFLHFRITICVQIRVRKLQLPNNWDIVQQQKLGHEEILGRSRTSALTYLVPWL